MLELLHRLFAGQVRDLIEAVVDLVSELQWHLNDEVLSALQDLSERASQERQACHVGVAQEQIEYESALLVAFRLLREQGHLVYI